MPPRSNPGSSITWATIPAVSGLNLNFNRVHFEWERTGADYRLTMDARSDRFRPEVSVARMQLADRSLPVYTWRDGGDEELWTVARRALGASGARWLPVRRPALYAGDVLPHLCGGAGADAGPAGRDRGRVAARRPNSSRTRARRSTRSRATCCSIRPTSRPNAWACRRPRQRGGADVAGRLGGRDDGVAAEQHRRPRRVPRSFRALGRRRASPRARWCGRWSPPVRRRAEAACSRRSR